MALTQMTTTTQANWIPELWIGSVNAYFSKPEKLLAQSIDLTPRIMARGTYGRGDTANITLMTKQSCRTKTSGTASTFDADTDDVASITFVELYKAKVLENVVKVQADPTLLDQKVEEAGKSVLRGMNTAVATAIKAGTVTQTLEYDNTMSGPELLTVLGTLLDLDIVPADGGVYLNCSTAFYKSLIELDDFVRYVNTGEPSPHRSGAVGNLLGIEVGHNNNWTDVGTTAEVTASIHVAEAVGWACTDGPKPWYQANDIRELADLFAVSTIFGAGAAVDSGIINLINP